MTKNMKEINRDKMVYSKLVMQKLIVSLEL